MDVGDREPTRDQLHRIDNDFHALGEPTPRVDLRHTRHRAQSRTYGVVVQRFQFGKRQRVTGEHILVQLTHRSRHRPERGLDAGGQGAPGIVQPLLHELPRKVDVDIVGKRYRDERETELGNRPHALGVRHTHQRRLDGVGDQSFDFFRCHAGCHGDDLHAGAGKIGERVECDVLQRVEPRRHQGQRDADNDTAIMQRKMYQGFHRLILRWGSGA